MGFPIAIGAKNSSCRPISPPTPIAEEYSQQGDDDVSLQPVIIDEGPRVILSVCSEKEWLACISLSYYDVMMEVHDGSENGSRIRRRQSTAVELRIQISPLSLPFSSDYRDCVHRITLPWSGERDDSPIDDTRHSDETYLCDNSSPAVKPSAIFSANRRHLCCLIPYPRGSNSALVHFQLRKPRSEIKRRPPLPSYIPEPPEKAFIPVATNPHLVKVPELLTPALRRNLLSVSAICDAAYATVKNDRPSSILLAGCRNGTILALSYRPDFAVTGVLYEPTIIALDSRISFLSYVTDTYGPTPGEANGKLVAIRGNGAAAVFRTHICVSSSADSGKPPSQRTLVETSQRSFTESSAYYKDETEREDATEFSFDYDSPFHSTTVSQFGNPETTYGCDNNSHASQRFPERRYSIVGIDTIRAEPLMELVGKFSGAAWITGSLLAVLSAPDGVSVSQVWSISKDSPSERISELRVGDDTLREHSHSSFFFDDTADSFYKQHAEGRDSSTFMQKWEGTIGIEYDAYCGCLSVSSSLLSSVGEHNDYRESDACPFVCIWHWRTNTIGFTARAQSLTSTPSLRFHLISRLFFARDKQSGLKLSHVSASIDLSWTTHNHRIRKQLHCTGLLSPPQDFSCGSGWGVEETCPLLLSASSVAFPSISRSTSSDTCEVEWQESRIPNEYLSSYGYPRIATFGRDRGQSIAIASSSGICVLDCSRVIAGSERSWEFVQQNDVGKEHKAIAAKITKQANPKWRLFGNVSQERAFRVLALAWWEGQAVTRIPNHDKSDCDDLLVAIIQLQDNTEMSSGYYLACWSPQRFDVAHQLLAPVKRSSEIKSSQWGIQLPDDFHQVSLRLLAQPDAVSSQQHQRRAVLLVSAPGESNSSNDLQYELFQLQVIPSKLHQPQSYVEQKPYTVFTRRCSVGEIKPFSSEDISGVFLASASFNFDLFKDKNPSKTSGSDSISANGQNCHFFATIGVLRSPGGGIDAVTVSSAGASSCTPILTPHNDKSSSRRVLNSEVTAYWFADVVNGCSISGDDSNTDVDFFVWTFLLADGRLLCWSVPYLSCRTDGGHDIGSIPFTNGFSLFHANANTGAPRIVCSNGQKEDLMLGIVCPVGTSDTWLSQSASRSKNDFAIGCLPGSSLGCSLSVGQGARKSHRMFPSTFDHQSFFAGISEQEILCPGDFILTPPVFISSVFALVLEACLIRTDLLVRHTAASSKLVSRLKTTISHTQNRLHLSPNQDAVFMSLRLLALRSVEDIAEQSSPNTKHLPSRDLASSFFAQIVDIVRHCTSGLQFANLMLEVGRQLEPSSFPYFFPLPPPLDILDNAQTSLQSLREENTDSKECRTVADLFNVCMEEGSILTSVAALPLFSSRKLSLFISLQIFCHCLEILEYNTISENEILFDHSREERQVLHDIFRFGFKLEDTTSDQALDQPYDAESENEGYFAIQQQLDSVDSVVDGNGPGQLPVDLEQESEASVSSSSSNTSGRDGSFSIACGMIKSPLRSPWSCRSGRRPISEGSSSSNDENSQKSEKRDPVQSLDFESLDLAKRYAAESFAAVAGRFILKTISETDVPARWKRASALACILLGQYSSMFQRCSAFDWVLLAEELRQSDVEHLAPTATKDIGACIAEFLVLNIEHCSSDISACEADRILDLGMILLQRLKYSEDLMNEIPDLMIVCIIVAHVSERIDELLGTMKDCAPIKEFYLQAKTILLEKHCSF